MDNVAVAILNLQGDKEGSVEVDHSKVVEKTIFELRGFGEFRVKWGIGAYGKELNACTRRMSAYEKEEVLASGSRCLLSNRIAYGLSALKFGGFLQRKGR